MGMNRTRWETIWLLRRGEFGYAGHELTKLVHYMSEDFASAVMRCFRECDYVRCADLIEYQWRDME